MIDVLEASRGTSLDADELADALTGADGRRPRSRDLRRRTLPPLVEAAVVECVAGKYRLAPDWRVALDRRRKEDGEIQAAERQRNDHARARENFLEAWRRGEVLAADELARRRRRRGLARDQIAPEERHISGSPAELERVDFGDPFDGLGRLYALVDRRVITRRGPGVLIQVFDDELRVAFDADPSRWVPIAHGELLGAA